VRVPTWRKATTAARIMVAGPPRAGATAPETGRTDHVASDAHL
jgi:hypothetical protein